MFQSKKRRESRPMTGIKNHPFLKHAFSGFSALGLVIVLTFLSACGSSNNDQTVDGATQPSPHQTTPSFNNTPVPVSIARPQGAKVVNRPLPYAKDKTISYCESVEGKLESYNGFQDLKPYPLASLSKIFVSAWALSQLGPDYTFEVIWKINPVPGKKGVFDAYLRSNYDPAMNIEKILFSIAQLQKKGVRRFRNLAIDETTRIYLSVFSNPHVELEDVPVSSKQSLENLDRVLNSTNWASQTQKAVENLNAWAVQKKMSLQVPESFSVDHIELVNSEAASKEFYADSIVIRSTILLKYLKNINVTSNNYMTDAFFHLLGGPQGFRHFQKKTLLISDEELSMYTGSGLPIAISGQRFDNLGTCLSLLKVLQFLDVRSTESQVNLGHILLSAGQDPEGTYESELSFSKDVVLKTGRLYDVPALNVAGVVQLQKKKLYFAFMAHDFDNSIEDSIKSKRDQLIQSILDFYPTQTGFQTLSQDEIFHAL